MIDGCNHAQTTPKSWHITSITVAYILWPYTHLVSATATPSWAGNSNIPTKIAIFATHIESSYVFFLVDFLVTRL